ncbi:MAG: hypothetical protein ACIRZZ_02880, partial [Lactobacillus gallinarum]
ISYREGFSKVHKIIDTLFFYQIGPSTNAVILGLPLHIYISTASIIRLVVPYQAFLKGVM